MCLTEKVKELEREQAISSHALADKDAQLQLQETRNEVKQYCDPVLVGKSCGTFE